MKNIASSVIVLLIVGMVAGQLGLMGKDPEKLCQKGCTKENEKCCVNLGSAMKPNYFCFPYEKKGYQCTNSPSDDNVYEDSGRCPCMKDLKCNSNNMCVAG